MNNYRYTLQPYKGINTRHRCPQCDKPKKYTRYIDNQTKELLPFEYGKCERLDNCGYHLNPYKNGYHKGKKSNSDWQPIQQPERPKDPVFIPFNLFNGSLRHYDRNSFASFLIGLFGTEKATELIQRFYIGTSKYWNGATVFWVIDEQMRIAGGQVVLFDDKGNTKKKKMKNGSTFRYTRWVHSALKESYKKQNKPVPQWLIDYCKHGNKFPVPFGLPQIQDDCTKPIAIVEAPKTAVIATGFCPQFNWVAIGGASYLNNIYRVKPLEGKKIVLFPDKGQFQKWTTKAKEYSHLADFEVSDLLECKNAPEGSDLADYLVQFNYNDFQRSQISTNENQSNQLPIGWQIQNQIILNEHGYPAMWDNKNIKLIESLIQKFDLIPEA